MAISLPDATKRELLSSIKQYFLEERDEEMGDLQASFLLDFVLREIGPSIYNQAVKDAQARLSEVVSELDVSLHEPEAAYTAGRTSGRVGSRGVSG